MHGCQQRFRPVCALLLLCAVAAAGSAACAYPKTAKLAKWNLASGYRFTRADAAPVNAQATIEERRTALARADKVFVVLTFSGGGTRAGALSYGVLRQLEHVKVGLTKEGELCSPQHPPADCQERTLLDEVDVISSVSGGSFPAAYYALKGKEIFAPTSAFQRRFLYHNIQRDLVGSLIYYPRSWSNIGSRIEIAARHYQKHIFGKATFADLAMRPRPFAIINADDMSTGNRFEFTQDQFDLLCADLAEFPIARAVAASSAFPGLLNSMTIDSHNGADPKVSPCAYTGPGSPDVDEEFDYLPAVLQAKAIERRRYRAALALMNYRDPRRKHLHLLDGGLADNIGLRSVLTSLSSPDRPTANATNPDEINAEAGRLVGGWSVQQLINSKRIKTLIVISVNARTEKTKDWDRRARGPSTFAVLGATRGTPMGSFSHESVDLIQQEAVALLKEAPHVEAFAFEVAFDDIADPAERDYFLNLPTTFGLSRDQIGCLVDRGPALLRDARVLNWNPNAAPQGPPTFSEVVRDRLFGRVDTPALIGSPASCRAS